MTVVKINAITVPADSGDELAHRFAARAHSVDEQPGFEGFELLKPQDVDLPWLVVTRWADEASFEAWQSSRSFAQGHAHGGDQGEHGADAPRRAPVATSAQLWSYVPVVDNR